MHVICEKELLLENINYALRAVSTKTTMPILECILVSAREAGLNMFSNDLEMSIETADIPSDILEPGSIALDAKVFSEIIRKMPDGPISIIVDANNITAIKNGKVEFKIVGVSGDEFPYLPQVEKHSGYKVKASIFKNMIRQTIFSVSVDDTKQALTGELIEIVNGEIRIVSVDGFRISYRSTPIDITEEEARVIVPGKTLNEISKILPTENEEDLSIYFTDKHILFELEKFTLISRLLDGDFLRYDQSFTNDYSTMVHVNKNDLIMSIERSMLISKDAKKNPVKFQIKDDWMVITSNTDIGNSHDEINIETDGDELTIRFNPRYILDVLKVIDDEKVSLRFTTSLSPCIIKSEDNTGYKYLVLPLRIKD